MIEMGGIADQWITPLPHSKMVQSWAFLFPCSAWVLSRHSSFLPHSKNMHGIRLISDTKLAVGVNVR